MFCQNLKRLAVGMDMGTNFLASRAITLKIVIF
jgi:hypothetical protein